MTASRHPLIVGELQEGDEVDQLEAGRTVTRVVAKAVPGPRGVVTVWFSEADYWTVHGTRLVQARRPALVPDSGWEPVRGDVVRVANGPGLWRIVHLPDDGLPVMLRNAGRPGTGLMTAPLADLRPTVTTVVERGLGERQQSVLRSLREHGAWPWNGWTYTTLSETRRIVASLERRGLAVRVHAGDPAGAVGRRSELWEASTPAALARQDRPERGPA